jgi:hypothetical protein
LEEYNEFSTEKINNMPELENLEEISDSLFQNYEFIEGKMEISDHNNRFCHSILF